MRVLSTEGINSERKRRQNVCFDWKLKLSRHYTAHFSLKGSREQYLMNSFYKMLQDPPCTCGKHYPFLSSLPTGFQFWTGWQNAQLKKNFLSLPCSYERKWQSSGEWDTSGGLLEISGIFVFLIKRADVSGVTLLFYTLYLPWNSEAKAALRTNQEIHRFRLWSQLAMNLCQWSLNSGFLIWGKESSIFVVVVVPQMIFCIATCWWTHS